MGWVETKFPDGHIEIYGEQPRKFRDDHGSLEKFPFEHEAWGTPNGELAELRKIGRDIIAETEAQTAAIQKIFADCAEQGRIAGEKYNALQASMRNDRLKRKVA